MTLSYQRESSRCECLRGVAVFGVYIVAAHSLPPTAPGVTVQEDKSGVGL